MARYWLLGIEGSGGYGELLGTIPTPITYEAANDTEALLFALSIGDGEDVGDIEVSENEDDAKEMISSIFGIPATAEEKEDSDDTSWQDYDQMSDEDKQAFCTSMLDDNITEPDLALVLGVQNMDTGKFIYVLKDADISGDLKDAFANISGSDPHPYYDVPTKNELANMGLPTPLPNETVDDYFARYYEDILPSSAKRFMALKPQISG